MERLIAYVRTSTARQSLGLDAQRHAIRSFCSGGAEVIAEYVEQESGKRHDNRPQLAKALAHCRRARAKLCIAKLDRLARNVAFISALMESGVEFIACDMPMANKLTIHILAAVAEHEREMIAQRTKDALAVRRGQGVRLGNPSNLKQAGALGRAASRANADQRAANVLPIIERIREQGTTTLAAIAEELNARNIATPRKGLWHAGSVARMLQREQVMTAL